MTATLSIRNTDPVHAITVLSVKYFDSRGKIVQNYTAQPLHLEPLASTQFFVKESDTSKE